MAPTSLSTSTLSSNFSAIVTLSFCSNGRRKAFRKFRAVPPDTGIVHQVNLEYLASVVFRIQETDGSWTACPDSLTIQTPPNHEKLPLNSYRPGTGAAQEYDHLPLSTKG